MALGGDAMVPDHMPHVQPEAAPWVTDEPPLTRAEVYRSLSGCYEECGKQVQAVVGQITSNNTMVAQLAGRIAAAEQLMTDHVAKLEERVHTLEATLEQELQSPGMVNTALGQLGHLKVELENMKQLMDAHPLQVAQRLHVLEKKMAESAVMAQQEMAGLRQAVAQEILPQVHQQLQQVPAVVMLEFEKRLKASEERTQQLVAAEMAQLRRSMEMAMVELASHAAQVNQRQKLVEETVQVQLTAMMAQVQELQTPSSSPPMPAVMPPPPSTPSMHRPQSMGSRMSSRSRSRSRSADAPPARVAVMVGPQTGGPGPTNSSGMEDIETKVANAVMVAMQRMGMMAQAAPHRQ